MVPPRTRVPVARKVFIIGESMSESPKNYERIDTFTIEPVSEATLVAANEMRLQSWLDTYRNDQLGITPEWLEARNQMQRSAEALERRKARLKSTDSHGWVALDSVGNVIGLTGSFVDAEGHQHVGSLYTAKEWHGKGVGSALMERVIGSFDAAKPIELGVVTYNERAKSFYRKWGFEEVAGSETMFEDKLPEVKMIRRGDIPHEV